MVKVGIVGYAQSKFEPDRRTSRDSLIYEVTKEVMKNANMRRDDISTFVSATNDFYEGRTISNCFTVETSGSMWHDETKVEMDGAWAILYGAERVLSGHHNVALVWGGSMGSTFEYDQTDVLAVDPTIDRTNFFLNHLTAAAFQMRGYMGKYGVTEEQIAKVAVKNRKNAALNPLVEPKTPNITVKEVLESKMLASPVRELMYAGNCDGVCAVILAAEEQAKKICDNPVWITGIGCDQDSYYLSDRTLFANESAKIAAQRAYKMAGITDPAKELGVVEMSEKFAHEEPILAEAFGICNDGQGIQNLEAGKSDIKGALPINPSGGALGANPLLATGIARVVEVAKQIRGDADGHQVKNKVKKGLAHGQVGLCAQSNIVLIMEGN